MKMKKPSAKYPKSCIWPKQKERHDRRIELWKKQNSQTVPDQEETIEDIGEFIKMYLDVKKFS